MVPGVRQHAGATAGPAGPATGGDHRAGIVILDDTSTTECLSCAETGASVLARTTVRLAMGDRSGTVDLCDDHLEALRQAVEPVLAASARRSRRRPDDAAVPRLRDGEDREHIRRWARREGLPVSSVGTISHLVLESYRNAHPADPDGPVVVLP